MTTIVDIVTEVFADQVDSIGPDEVEACVQRFLAGEPLETVTIPAKHRMTLAQAYEVIHQAISFTADLLTVCSTAPLAIKSVKDLLQAWDKMPSKRIPTQRDIADKKEVLAQKALDSTSKQ